MTPRIAWNSGYTLFSYWVVPKNIHTIRRAPRISEGELGVNGLEFQVGGWQGGGSVLDFQKGITVSQIKHKL